MKKIIVLWFAFMVSFGILNAQKKKADEYTEADLENMVFKNEWSLGVKLHTNGFGAGFERVWIKNIWKKRVLQTNFFYFKDFKDKKTKTEFAQFTSAKGYFYGKQNSFWNINILYGAKKIIANKADQNGVQMCMFYMGGVSLGFLKPYSLAFVDLDNSQGGNLSIYAEVYDESKKEKFLSIDPTQDPVYGAAGIRYGFNKIKPIPGAHAKFGFSFDFGANDYVVKSIEVGTQIDVFYKKLPIYISDRNKPYIINLYLAFMFGKRW